MSIEVHEKSDYAAHEARQKGNEFYKKSEYFKALLLYNQSLCYAESKHELAFGYANRSAAYFKVHQYDKCMRNILLARNHGYPENKIKKLREREFECKKLMNELKPDPTEDPWNFFKLSYEPNPKVPFLVNCLEIRNSNAGKVLVTNQDLKPGDIIAITDTIFRFADPTARCHRCSYCFADCLMDLEPCNGCAAGEIMEHNSN